uniref:Uncharacterized protein n=1 Tax=Zosterops lateralis melanops TaxID=1220523 RepID=A0A8D2NPF2_ZOSLA
MFTEAELLPVGVLEVEAAAQHLQEHAAELLGGDVVQQRVHHRAEVEEDVGDGKEADVGFQVGRGPVMLGLSSSHDPLDLVWHPANRQSRDDQSCGQREQERGAVPYMKTQREQKLRSGCFPAAGVSWWGSSHSVSPC